MISQVKKALVILGEKISIVKKNSYFFMSCNITVGGSAYLPTGLFSHSVEICEFFYLWKSVFIARSTIKNISLTK